MFFFQAEDGIRGPLWSRGLGDVYKRQTTVFTRVKAASKRIPQERKFAIVGIHNARLKNLFGDTENGVDTPVSYEMSEGYIKIMPVTS